MRLEFLIKLYFAHHQAPETVMQLLEQQMQTCQQWLADLQTQASAGAHGRFFDFAVQRFRLNQIESFLHWLASCQQALAVAP